MPTISVNKAEFYERIGQVYTKEAFDQLCFDFGIELDEDTTEDVLAAKKAGLPTEEPQLKIEIPANRYDLLCIEGLARALNIFLGREQPPVYKLAEPKGEMITVHVEDSVKQIRPFFSALVLRFAKPFTQSSYDSFIDLQDKLHANLCRNRKFVAIGTHDLDTIVGPFRYQALPKDDIKFAPLNKDTEYTGSELMTLYENDRHLSKFLPLIRESPVYPIIYDSKDRVLSMPPIINSQHSKITLQTKNVFIDMTATDETKLEIVAAIMGGMFAEYSENPFTIEPVKLVYSDGSSKIVPEIAPRITTASVNYINSASGFTPKLSASEIAKLLNRMSLTASVSATNPDEELVVSIPAIRSDILHECDIMEDAAVAYGFNKITKTFPRTNTVGKVLPINKLADLIRKECAMAGWVEVLPYILCSHNENFAWLNRKDPGGYAISLSNPATIEYEIVRTSLLPGLLKTLRENRMHSIPLQLFEVSDVAVQDLTLERRSKNIRKMAALWCNKTAGFEVVHGLLDRMMRILGIKYIGTASSDATTGYYIQEAEDPTYFPGRAATIHYRCPTTPPSAETSVPHASPLDGLKSALGSVLPGSTSKTGDLVVGTIGILHPSVLEKFEISFPCSSLEIDLEPFL